MAASRRLRWPTETTPMSFRSSPFRSRRVCASMSLSANARAYCSSPSPRSQAPMSTRALPRRARQPRCPEFSTWPGRTRQSLPRRPGPAPGRRRSDELPWLIPSDSYQGPLIMTHRDGFPRFSARSAWRGDAGHRKPCGTPSESPGKPPFRSRGRTAGGRRQALTMPRSRLGEASGGARVAGSFPPIRRIACPISRGHYQRSLVLLPSALRP